MRRPGVSANSDLRASAQGENQFDIEYSMGK
jgi:hypothetical protein